MNDVTLSVVPETTSSDQSFHSPEELVQAIRAGEKVILLDDEDRENEGDLIMAACHVTADDINFMAQHARGLICLPITEERRQQLRLPPMVKSNRLRFSTNFTVSIEAAKGVTTGISAADRAATVHAAVAADAKPEDLVQPGHIFPITAQAGGVLARAGHTEASVDLARLAGLEPAAVIVEILNDDGSMARRPALEAFAKKHQLKIGTIADLIHYRLAHENTIIPHSVRPLMTAFGEFHLHAYQDTIDHRVHLALVKGDVQDGKPTLVRVHHQDTLFDLLQATPAVSGRWTLQQAMQHIAQADRGVVVLLNHTESAEQLLQRAADCQSTATDNTASVPQQGVREIGIGSQILRHLGVQKMRLLSLPKRVYALSGFGLEVVEHIANPREVTL